MHIGIIKTQEAYRDALARVETLALLDPDHGTPDAEQLELLALLVEDYERRNYPIDAPDPVSAIEFRMAEQGLRQRDLVPMLGSRSRVSEVLGRKRPLTLPMIRALSEGLGIPTDLLVRPIEEPQTTTQRSVDWLRFPFREMQKRGWIPQERVSDPKKIEKIVKDFLDRAGQVPEAVALFRRSLTGLGAKNLDEAAIYSTVAWVARVRQRSISKKHIAKFSINHLTDSFLSDLSKLSRHDQGPILAIEMLNSIGISVIIEPRLPNTLLDGAAMLNERMEPVIGLTLRFDRVDYFWFTLLHEIAHVWKHINSVKETFVDRIDATSDDERRETEANRIAREALIPRSSWEASVARLRPTSDSIKDFAEEINIHPAIVAGRIRFETDDYSRFTRLLGQGLIRKHFHNIKF